MKKSEWNLLIGSALVILLIASVPILHNAYRTIVLDWHQNRLKQQQADYQAQKQDIKEKTQMLVGAWQLVVGATDSAEPVRGQNGHLLRRIFYRDGRYNEFTWAINWDNKWKRYTVSKFSLPANREPFKYKVLEKSRDDYGVELWNVPALRAYKRGTRPGFEQQFNQRTEFIRIFPDTIEIAPPTGSPQEQRTWHRIPMKGHEAFRLPNNFS